MRRDSKSYVGVIADIVKSRELAPRTRRSIQKLLHNKLEEINHKYKAIIAAKFLITTGDEIQGLLNSAVELADMIWDFEDIDINLRIGIGRGRLTTDLKEFAIGMDGPVWHRAREAITRSRAENRLGGVFLGFGESQDVIMNGFARVLRWQRATFTKRQRQVVALLRTGLSQTEVAEKLHITKQSVHDHVVGTGWQSYIEGETAWKECLQAM